MAGEKKIGPRQKKFREGGYDPIIRAIPLFLAIPILALLAIDLNRYEENSALHHVQHRPSLILDGISIAFVAITILWDFLYLTVSQYRKISPALVALMDFLISTSLIALGDTNLSGRTATNSCFRPLGECSASAHRIMQAVGALLIIASLPHHVLWGAACGKNYARRRQERKKRKAACADGAPANSEIISFSNDFLPKESVAAMDAVIVEPNPLPFSNEIK